VQAASRRLVQEHGDEFCAAILDGKRKRDDVSRQAAA
jgi:hypothetical protein